jgi:hypothetical protein
LSSFGDAPTFAARVDVVEQLRRQPHGDDGVMPGGHPRFLRRLFMFYVIQKQGPRKQNRSMQTLPPTLAVLRLLRRCRCKRDGSFGPSFCTGLANVYNDLDLVNSRTGEIANALHERSKHGVQEASSFLRVPSRAACRCLL